MSTLKLCSPFDCYLEPLIDPYVRDTIFFRVNYAILTGQKSNGQFLNILSDHIGHIF